ncbi:MAG: sugar phosphate nucleotidyltransferase [Dehalococcoidia bacterium]
MSNQRTIVIVLAGGSNSRYAPLRDKTLLPIFGRPLLAHHLDALAAVGFHDVVVVANARTEGRIRTLLDAYRRPGRIVEVAVQREAAGMGDAVLTATRALGDAAAGPLLITQAHDVVEPDLFGRMAEAAVSAPDGVHGFITGKQMPEYFPAGYLQEDANGRLTDIVEKPGAGNEPGDLISLVIHWHRDGRALAGAIERQYVDNVITDDHYERALADLFRQQRYQVLRYAGEWRPIKYPWHVLDVMDFYLARAPREPAIEGVRIFPGAQVVGPAYIGPGSIVGNESLVRGSMIGANTEVGYGCEVARSWVGSDVHLHHAYVGDTVVDNGAGLAFGTVTANWPFYPSPVRSTVGAERLKTSREKFGAIIGARVRTGIGVLIYPGVKIGYGAYIGPGVVVLGDIEPGKLVIVKQELNVRDNPFVPPE